MTLAANNYILKGRPDCRGGRFKIEKMLDLEQQIFRQLEKSKNILLVFPADQSGDTTASALAFFLFLKKLGKEVEIVGANNKGKNKLLSFLPASTEIRDDLHNLRRFIVSLNISQSKVNQIKYTVDREQLNFIISPASGWFKSEDVTTRAGEFKYDLILALGTSDLEALGKIYDDNVEFFYKTTIVNIDHRSANEDFGQINFVDLNAVATAEILFYLLKNYKPQLIDEDIASCLLAGIILETKNFKTANLTPRTLLTTSQLISLGARREEIVNHLYRSRDFVSLKLWGKVLSNLKSERNGEFLWSRLSALDCQGVDTADDKLTEIVDELIANVPSAKIVAILREEATDKTKLLIYSLKNINALDFIKEYAARGTIKIAQALINQDLETATVEVVVNLRNKLDKLTS
ncbi:MAG: Phosphoesterase RecJ domain protein [Candidatus Falkowbacteria bacterium GW2011_GWF2_43_32]|nr:MAG: Phosphoesterase RecJ domain protein [Candidatus Falkowbacteria bacterium GW2011_GWF2_43_32]